MSGTGLYMHFRRNLAFQDQFSIRNIDSHLCLMGRQDRFRNRGALTGAHRLEDATLFFERQRLEVIFEVLRTRAAGKGCPSMVSLTGIGRFDLALGTL
jgi:hypothetical protein